MSSPASTAPSVKAFLVAQIQASPDLPATILGSRPLVSYGVPAVNVPAVAVAVGTRVTAVVTPTQMVGGGGAGWLFERYMLEVVVEAFAGTDDRQSVDEAAYSLWQVVCATVRSDPSLGGRVIQANPADWESTSDWTDDHSGYLCRLVGQIEVEAEL